MPILVTRKGRLRAVTHAATLVRNEEGRSAHVNGELAKALFAPAGELFVTHPQVQLVDIVAEKN